MAINQGTAMVKAILAMSPSLGIQVVAEGIETLPQMSTLQARGCQFGQGYLFSQPYDAQGVEAWMAQLPKELFRSQLPLEAI